MKNYSQSAWQAALIAAGVSPGQINDMEMSFLNGQGFITGNLEDRWYNHLRGKGYSGSLVDMINAARAADDLLGANVLDINSIYGASDVGDYFISATGAFTDAGTTAATTSGDTIQQWEGQRSAGTSITVTQTTASSKPELATDGTYGLSTLFPAGALKWISDEAFAGALGLQGVRFRLDNVTAGSGTTAGMTFGASDFSGFSAAPAGVAYNLQVVSRGNTPVLSSTLSDTNWHTLVVQWEVDGANNFVRIYLDDMDTPVTTANIGGLPSLINFRLGHQSGMLSGVHVYKTASHGTWNAATPAELASWLEA